MRIKIVAAVEPQTAPPTAEDLYYYRTKLEDKLWCLCRGYKQAMHIYELAHSDMFEFARESASALKGAYVKEIINTIEELQRVVENEKMF